MVVIETTITLRFQWPFMLESVKWMQIGASEGELSFTVYWIVRGLAMGTLLSKIDGLVTMVPSSDNKTLFAALFLSAGLVSIAFTLMQNSTHL